MKMQHAFPSSQAALHTWISRLRCTPETPHPSLAVHSPNRRVFTEDFVAYSYGHHFPIVRWMPEHKAFLLNIDRYSATTSKHQREAGGLVLQYAPYLNAHVFHVSWCNAQCWLPEKFPEDALAFYHNTIRTALAKGKRARLQCRKQWERESAERWITERNQFIRTFKVDAPELPEDVTAALVALKLAA